MKTIRVRIPVLVDERGDWAAVGASSDVSDYPIKPLSDERAIRCSREMLPERWDDEPDAQLRLTWIVADVPVPTVDDEMTVEGRREGEA